MDASNRTTRPYRRRKLRNRLMLLCVLAFFVAKQWRSNRAEVDPALIQSGPYQLARVNSNGSLRLIVPDTDPNEINVCWLGIEITKPEEASKWLNSISLSDPIQVRLDRRRVDQNGNLQAYFFQDDLLLNAELVRLGFAVESTHPSDFAPIARQIRQAKSLNANLSQSK